ncbi:MAG: hypothetical protein ACKPKO_03750, partial [Candidatus Fonsibacter sp.]
MSVDINDTKLVRASSCIPTPESFSNAKFCLTNIQIADELCFRWCMQPHPSDNGKHDATLFSLISENN